MKPRSCASRSRWKSGGWKRPSVCFADRGFAPEELIGEPSRGIRPAPGCPAQPDRTEKAALFRLLDAERAIGVRLTKSFAMGPASSAHPEAHCFGVAKVERDQIEDSAPREGMDVAEVERWLAPAPNSVAIRAEAAQQGGASPWT